MLSKDGGTIAENIFVWAPGFARDVIRRFEQDYGLDASVWEDIASHPGTLVFYTPSGEEVACYGGLTAGAVFSLI